jgi:hypothetical protein
MGDHQVGVASITSHSNRVVEQRTERVLRHGGRMLPLVNARGGGIGAARGVGEGIMAMRALAKVSVRLGRKRGRRERTWRVQGHRCRAGQGRAIVSEVPTTEDE